MDAPVKALNTEKAKALQAADVKVIANAGNAGEGMGRAMDLFSSKGGTNLAAAVEAFAQSPLGNAMIGKILKGGTESQTPAPEAAASEPVVENPADWQVDEADVTGDPKGRKA